MLFQDVRYSARMMLRKPAVTVVAVLTLALGIGANTAILSVVDALLLSRLPFSNADRLAVVWNSAPQLGYPQGPIAYGTFVDITEQASSFDQLAAWELFDKDVNLSGLGEPEQVRRALVSSNLFSVLGVQPILGRAFQQQDDKPGSSQVAVISEGLWKRKFSADPLLMGKQMVLHSDSYTVIGVMPASCAFPASGKAPEVWLLLSQVKFPWWDRNNRDSHDFGVVGTVRQETDFLQAQTEMDGLAGRLVDAYSKSNTGIGIRVVPLQRQAVKNIRQSLMLLLGAVAFVLLIACTNVANILLARALSRQKEIALRLALGASRLRIIRQLLTESVMFSLAGGAAGLILAFWGVELLSKIPAGKLDLYVPFVLAPDQARLNAPVLGFTFALSLAVGVLFGLVPALQASRPDLNVALKEGSQIGLSKAGRTRSALVVCQVALSLILLIGAALMVRSFLKLQEVDPGFPVENVITAKILLPGAKYYRPRVQRAFFEDVLKGVREIPGVKAAGITRGLPLSEDDTSRFMTIEGQPVPEPARRKVSQFHYVSADYFQALGVELVKGRFFNDRDTYDAQPVAIVNERFVRDFLFGEEPLGKRISPGDRGWYEIVGVVNDARFVSLGEEPMPECYGTYFQFFNLEMTMVVRAEADPRNLIGSIRSEVLAVDPDQPIANIQTMTERISNSVARPRYTATLVSLFAVLALVLAAVGIYGVVSYSVLQRTREIGIRIALGAQRRDVLLLGLKQGLGLTVLGVVVGIAGAFALTRVLGSLLYGVTPTDPLTFTMVSLLLTGVALIACWIPARRATRVDPMVALRYE